MLLVITIILFIWLAEVAAVVLTLALLWFVDWLAKTGGHF